MFKKMGEKLVAERVLKNAMDKNVVKVVKGNETVDQLPRKFSRTAWHFLARSEKNIVKVNASWSLAFQTKCK